MKSAVWTGVCLAVLVAACGGPMSTTQYVESLNALIVLGRSELDLTYSEYGQISEPTMEENIALLEREVTIRAKVHQSLEDLDPSDQLAEVHGLLLAVSNRLLTATEALVAVARTASSLDEVEQGDEFAEYREANAASLEMCLEVQAIFDASAARLEAFADMPWIPNDLDLPVTAALGCGEPIGA